VGSADLEASELSDRRGETLIVYTTAAVQGNLARRVRKEVQHLSIGYVAHVDRTGRVKVGKIVTWKVRDAFGAVQAGAGTICAVDERDVH
jgi:hypothetical protein